MLARSSMILPSSLNSRIRIPIHPRLTLRQSLRPRLVGLLASPVSARAKLNKPHQPLGLLELLAVLQEVSSVKQEPLLLLPSLEAPNQTRVLLPLPVFPYLSRRAHLSGNNLAEEALYLGILPRLSLASDKLPNNQQKLKHNHPK